LFEKIIVTAERRVQVLEQKKNKSDKPSVLYVYACTFLYESRNVILNLCDHAHRNLSG